ncbi:MAG: hypothetical protein KI788_03945 [Mameliella sp.]|nr:hypothetical protein [Mameliella sp.]
MGDRRITKDNPQPGRIRSILRQIEELSFKDFRALADYLGKDPDSLLASVEHGIKGEIEKETEGKGYTPGGFSR